MPMPHTTRGSVPPGLTDKIRRFNMGNIPDNRRDLLAFGLSHADTWQTAAQEIGLTNAQAARVKADSGTTQGKQNSVEIQRDAVKTATRELSENYTDLRRSVAEAVRTITTFAENQPTQKLRLAVFNTANIEPPAPRRNNVPPRVATELKVSLDATTGALQLRWKAAQPAGVVYSVYRKTSTSSTFTLAGVTGEKKFIDLGLPGSPNIVSYYVVATKGTLSSSPGGTLEVRFGNGDERSEFTTRTTSTLRAGSANPRLAA